MPRTRFGDLRVFNSLNATTGNLCGTNTGIQTRLLVEAKCTSA